MLTLAAAWQSTEMPSPAAVDATIADPEMGRYLRDWGRAGDVALVAEDAEGRPIGAAWFRLMTAEEPGYGFITEAIPEVSIAVVPDWRGKGVGGALLTALLDAGWAAGFAAISLSVSKVNPAAALYKRLGFVRVGEFGRSWTMRADAPG